MTDDTTSRPLTDHGTLRAGARKVWDPETRSFKEGRAKPALIDPELRKLPSEYVTKEIEDGSKIHELDPSHVRGSIAEDMAKAQEARSAPESPKARFERLLDDPNSVLGAAIHPFLTPAADARLDECRLTHQRVDWSRFSALLQKIKTAVTLVEAGDADLNVAMIWLKSVQHVWFPFDDCRISEIREGRPPPRFELPQRLRGFSLEVDVFNWPPRIVDLFKLAGVQVPDWTQIEKDMEYAAQMLIYNQEPEDGEE